MRMERRVARETRACRGGSTSIIRALLDAGTPPVLVGTQYDPAGVTSFPLLRAATFSALSSLRSPPAPAYFDAVG